MKDSFFFTHDSNAKDDPKIIMLIEELGLEGYGIYWVLVEVLREQPDFKADLKIIPALARRYNTTAEKMKAVIIRYELFEIEDDTFFYSESLQRRMLKYSEVKEKRRLAGKAGGKKRWQTDSKAIANASQTHSKAIAKHSYNNIVYDSIVYDNVDKTNSLSFPQKVTEAKDVKELIALWCEYRKTKGKYPTLFEIDTLKHQWQSMDIEILKQQILQSVENGWLSLVDKKQTKTGGQEDERVY